MEVLLQQRALIAMFPRRLSHSVVRLLACLSVMMVLALSDNLAAAQSGADDDKVPAIAFAARLVGDEKRARLLVDFDKKVEYEVYLLDDPKRLIVDLSETVFSLNPDAKRLSSPLVSDLRQGTIEPGKSRIALDLTSGVTIAKQDLKSVSSNDRHRLIIDLVASSDEAFSQLARKPQDTFEAIAVQDKNAAGTRTFTIVLDPGHGGVDGGAAGKAGASEKVITLGFAKRLKAALEQESQFRVIMTRDDDSFVSLRKRLEIARKVKADLMISIHADSLRQRSIRGATVYTLSKRGSDEISRSLARKQNRSDLVAGLEIPETDSDVTDILIDLTRRETKAFSDNFARTMVQSMEKGIRLIGNPLRSADFFVLKAPEVPSVLLELGYLSNREDEKLMQTKKWQETVVALTKRSIITFFKPRMGQ